MLPRWSNKLIQEQAKKKPHTYVSVWPLSSHLPLSSPEAAVLLWAGREWRGDSGWAVSIPSPASPTVSRQDYMTRLTPWGASVLGSRMLCASAPAYPAKKEKNLEEHKQVGINVFSLVLGHLVKRCLDYRCYNQTSNLNVVLWIYLDFPGLHQIP